MQLPKRALLLADRLYGCAVFAAQARAVCERVGSHFLLRARTNLTARVITRLPDGSRIVRVPVRDPSRRMPIAQWLELREIRVRVGRRGRQPQDLRRCTTAN